MVKTTGEALRASKSTRIFLRVKIKSALDEVYPTLFLCDLKVL